MNSTTMANGSKTASIDRLRAFGVVPLVLFGVLTTLATGGGGGSNVVPNVPGTIQILASSYDAAEGTIVNIRVARSGGSSGSVSIDYETSDGTAEAGSDYDAVSGTLTWDNNVSGNQTVSIVISDDGEAEFLETFTLTLSNPVSATLGSVSSATVNIVDGDSADLSAFGVITDLASATVNGIRYDTDASIVTVNGQLSLAADLELGQVVTLEGEANFSEGTGTADRIDHAALVVGPVESIDAASRQIVVLGQTVVAETDTVFDPSIDPATFAGLAVGDTSQISGFHDSVGDIVATRIAPDTTTMGVQLIGQVEDLDLANLLLTINRQTVDYSSATLIDLPLGMPVDGQRVVVRGSLVDGIAVASELAGVEHFLPTPGSRVELAGVVTRFASTTDFDLNGFEVVTDSATLFPDGNAEDLQADAMITVDGQVMGGGDAVLAQRIVFGTPVSDRSTLPFDFVDFTRISVFGFARVTVTQAAEYSISVTADAGLVNDVVVTQNGDSVTFEPPQGLGNSPLYSATVTLPVLEELTVGADALANVMLDGFMQAQMTINVDGVSVVSGDSLSIDALTASVLGVSLLDLGTVTPIGVATVDIDGVSQATLNMGVGSTLSGSVSTGQGTGVSRLFYYGTNVTVNVTTDSQSIITRLGDTRL